jgi:hypothetical protein
MRRFVARFYTLFFKNYCRWWDRKELKKKKTNLPYLHGISLHVFVSIHLDGVEN